MHQLNGVEAKREGGDPHGMFDSTPTGRRRAPDHGRPQQWGGDLYPAAIGEISAALLRQYPPATAAQAGTSLVAALDAQDRLLALHEFLGGGPSLIITRQRNVKHHPKHDT
jgi:hypothetical protein